MYGQLQYGLDANGQLRHIDDVTNGLKCNCVCPNCGERLIAKNNGQVKIAHFAHSNGKECEGARMSRVHILAQRFFQDKKWIYLPEITYTFWGRTECLLKRRRVNFVDVKLENRYEIDSKTRIPDCVGVDRNGKELWIEIVFTHGIDKQKRQFIIDNNIACVEFNLSELSPDAEENEIYQKLTSQCYVDWVHCPSIQEKKGYMQARIRADHKQQLKQAKYHLVDYEVFVKNE